jgi:TPR repeat protein
VNWAYIGIAALLPLAIALAAMLLAGAIQAIRSNRNGGSSRAALLRFLRTLVLVFPLAFLLAALWDGWATWRGLGMAVLGHAADQRAVGILRSHGEGFLAKDQAKAAFWFRKGAEGGDAQAQLFLARALSKGLGVPRDLDGARRWARAAAVQGLPDAMVLAGDLFHAGDAASASAWYQNALTLYQQQIEAGNADASLACGLMHLAGKGVPKDPVEGVAYLYLARQLGLSSLKQVIVVLSEGPLTKPQRAEAAARAEALRKALPDPKN